MNIIERNCIYCVFNQSHSKKKIIIYKYCTHYRHEKPCRLFKYIAKLPQNDGMLFEVYFNQTCIAHELVMSEPCKGLAMENLQKEVLKMPPKQINLYQTSQVPLEQIETTMNCTQVQSVSLIKWARHKVLAKNDVPR